MGTQAQQALQRRSRAISPRDPRNSQGTRQAQQRASQSRRTSQHAGPAIQRKGSERSAGPPPPGQRSTEGQARYGGMGYGPTQAPDPAMKKAEARADPNALVQDTVNAMATPKSYRPAGSIYDDPVYGPMANSRSPEFAMKARNLDNMVNQARIADQIRGEAQENRIAMEEGKLRFQELEHARSPYAPDFQSTGVDPKTGLATSGTATVDRGPRDSQQPVFTGEGHQARMTGPGPQMEAEPEAQMTPQDKVKLVESYSKLLTDISTPEEVKAQILQALPQLLPQPQGGGGSQSPFPDYPDAFQEGDDWFVEQDGKRFRLELEE